MTSRFPMTRLMAGNRSCSTRAVALAAIGVIAGLAGAAQAATDLTWDTGSGAGVQTTSGTWDLATTNWTSDGGTSRQAWADSNNAIFTTTASAYVVTLSTPLSANNISFAGSGAGSVSLNSSTLTLGGTLTVASGNTVSIGSQLTGTGSIANSGTLTLTSKTSDFSGGVTLNAGGSLNMSGPGLGSHALGTGTLTLSGGTINTNLYTSETAVTNNIAFAGDGTFNNTNGSFSGAVDLGGQTRTITSSGSNTVGFGGRVTNGGIIIAGAKGISLSNISNTFAGGVTVSAGSALTYYGNSYTGTAGAVTAGTLGTGTLTIGNGTTFTTSGAAKAGNNLSINGNLSLNTNNMTFEGSVNLGGDNRTITILSTNGVTFSGKISNGGIILAGTTGNFSLTNTNSDFAGGVTVGANNTLSFSGTSTGTPGTVTRGPLGTGTLTINGGSITTSYVATGADVYNNAVIGGNFSITPDPASSFYGSWDLGSAIRSVNVHSSYSNKTLRLNNAIGGNGGGLTFTATRSGGTNTWTSGIIMEGTSSNTYTGLTTMNTTTANGNLTLNKSNGATAIAGDLLITSGIVKYTANNNQIANTSAVTVDGAAAFFDLGANHADTVGTVTLDGGGSITGTGTSSLTGSSYQMKNGSVSAILAGSGVALTKSTDGTVILSGINSYSGDTSITGGTLKLSASSTNNIASSSKILVGDSVANNGAKLDVTGLTGGAITLGATQTLAGHGSVLGGVKTVNGSTVAPGNSAGTLTMDFLHLDPDATLLYDLSASNHTVGGSINDYIVVNGDLTLDGTINLANLTQLTAGTYTLIHYTGTLTNNILDRGAGFGIAANPIYSIVADTTNKDINLIVQIPEPVSLALLCGVATVGLLGRRHRPANEREGTTSAVTRQRVDA